MKSATATPGMSEARPSAWDGLRLTAEDVGFEPTRLSPAGFQDRCTRPLCESSVGEATRECGVFENRLIRADQGGLR